MLACAGPNQKSTTRWTLKAVCCVFYCTLGRRDTDSSVQIRAVITAGLSTRCLLIGRDVKARFFLRGSGNFLLLQLIVHHARFPKQFTYGLLQNKVDM